MEEKSRKVLEFIINYTKENGYQPNYDEIKNYMNLKSKSSVYSIVDYMERAGKVKKVGSRAIKIC